MRRRPHPPCMVHSFPSMGISLNLYSDGFNAFQKRGRVGPALSGLPQTPPLGTPRLSGRRFASRPRPTAGLDPFCEETSVLGARVTHIYLFLPAGAARATLGSSLLCWTTDHTGGRPRPQLGVPPLPGASGCDGGDGDGRGEWAPGPRSESHCLVLRPHSWPPREVRPPRLYLTAVFPFVQHS